MSLIRPKNYIEAVRLKQCLALRKYVLHVDDELLERIFNFIANPNHSVRYNDGLLSFRDPNDDPVESISLPALGLFSSILLSSSRFYVSYPSSGYSGGDSGSSANNNNNNNNNNNG